MFKEEKNLKDPERDTIKDTSSMPAHLPPWRDGSGSYTKTNKLITALYMVTDIVDKDEPLRNKLRTLGIGIISDINTTPINILSKIREIMSFLDIASAINIVSEMNCSILKKEFLELNQSILSAQAEKESAHSINRQINLSEFFKEEFPPLLNKEGNEGRFLNNSPHPNPLLSKERGIDEEKFWKIVKAGFAHKRKKLSSNLKTLCQSKALADFGNKRAENLSLEDWIMLASKEEMNQPLE